MFDRRQWLRNMLGLPLLWAAGARAATPEVEIRDYKFHPARLEIRVGDSVRWVNREKRTTHTVLFAGVAGAVGVESERLFPGDAWQRSFEQAGAYAYGCGPHPEMQGLIVVTP